MTSRSARPGARSPPPPTPTAPTAATPPPTPPPQPPTPGCAPRGDGPRRWPTSTADGPPAPPPGTGPAGPVFAWRAVLLLPGRIRRGRLARMAVRTLAAAAVAGSAVMLILGTPSRGRGHWVRAVVGADRPQRPGAPARTMTASSGSKATPPAGPQAQGWPGTKPRAREDAGLGQGAGHPSAIGRACLADQATAIKAGLDSRVPARYPCGAADGDGMTRQPPPWRNKRPGKIADPGCEPNPGQPETRQDASRATTIKALALIPEITHG